MFLLVEIVYDHKTVTSYCMLACKLKKVWKGVVGYTVPTSSPKTKRTKFPLIFFFFHFGRLAEIME